jgi:hypothetical protein
MDPTTPPVPLVRAAQYCRMSTEHQQYSTANQEDIIREYARSRGFQIVRTYADEGKSGLSVAGRDSLRALIDDVQSGRADYAAVLVYDVSRWGRFQDADESAYYEYLPETTLNATTGLPVNITLTRLAKGAWSYHVAGAWESPVHEFGGR